MKKERRDGVRERLGFRVASHINIIIHLMFKLAFPSKILCKHLIIMFRK